MDMSTGMLDTEDASPSTLNATGVNFSNDTQAAEFLEALLDDTNLRIFGNAYARYFWYGAVAVISIAAIANFIQSISLRLRIRAAASNKPQPTKPQNAFTKYMATITALIREASYPQLMPVKQPWINIPPLGTIIVLLTYLGFVLALEFIDNEVEGAQHYQALSTRAAWLAVAQVSLLVLLAGKKNLIGYVTGTSYERLNTLHRWTSRVLLLLATLHLGYQNYGWSLYDLRQLEWSTDSCPPTGIAAYAILWWLNLSTLAPFRNWSYEFFVVQHIVTFFGFIIAVMMHLPSTALYSRIYIYVPIGLYLLDRAIRTARFAYCNLQPGQARLEAMDGGVTKVSVPVRRMKHWQPGSHILLKLPSLGLLQSHPATILSRPSSHNNDLVFILKGQKGFTKRLLTSATSSTISLLREGKKEEEPQTRIALIDGPYGGSQADFVAFDTVILIAASTGVTFATSLLLDIAHRATLGELPVRRVVFVWVVRNRTWTSWVTSESCTAYDQLRDAGIEVEIKIFVTCDDQFSAVSDTPAKNGCQCDNSIGPCCCTRIADSVVSDAGKERNVTVGAKPSIAATDVEKAVAPCCTRDVSSNARKALESRATFTSGRPLVEELLRQPLEQAEGETGVAVCGPPGLSITVRNTVARLSDERAVHKGSGAQGIYLHVEGFCW